MRTRGRPPRQALSESWSRLFPKHTPAGQPNVKARKNAFNATLQHGLWNFRIDAFQPLPTLTNNESWGSMRPKSYHLGHGLLRVPAFQSSSHLCDHYQETAIRGQASREGPPTLGFGLREAELFKVSGGVTRIFFPLTKQGRAERFT